jgi:hypothetical protein
VGGALGGAVGAAIGTDGEPRRAPAHHEPHYHGGHAYEGRPASGFCPPGQAKKGRC